MHRRRRRRRACGTVGPTIGRCRVFPGPVGQRQRRRRALRLARAVSATAARTVLDPRRLGQSDEFVQRRDGRSGGRGQFDPGRQQLGAGSGASSPYNAPLAVNIAPPPIAVSGNVYLLDANGNPTNPSGAAAVQVWMYGPNPSNGGLWEVECTPTASSDGVVSYSLPTGVYAPGFLRAYLGSRAAGTQRSPIVRFQRSDVVNLSIP